MGKPYLEIYIEETREKEISEEILLEQIGTAYQKLYDQEYELKTNGQKCIRIEFDSEEEFDKIYERSYSKYVYLFENFAKEFPEFENLFKESEESLQSTNTQPEQKEDSPNRFKSNYMTLRYKSNTVGPLRRFFGFTTRVNNVFGSNVINEEINDGYLRFINTKKDFIGLIQPTEKQTEWRKIFELRGIDLKNPLVKKFFDVVDEWYQKNPKD